MTHLVFVIGEDLEEYLVFLSGLILLPPRVNSWLRVHVTSFARQRRQPRAVLWRSRIVYFYRRARVAASESREDSFSSLPQPEQDSRAARDVFATLLAARGVAGQKRGLSAEEDNGVIERRGGEHQRISTQHRIITDFLAGLHDG